MVCGKEVLRQSSGTWDLWSYWKIRLGAGREQQSTQGLGERSYGGGFQEAGVLRCHNGSEGSVTVSLVLGSMHGAPERRKQLFTKYCPMPVSCKTGALREALGKEL